MAAEDFVRSWQGRVYRHIPGDSIFRPLETRFANRSRENHWNRAGEPTLYFATDRAQLIAAFTRHFERNRAPDLSGLVRTRRVLEIDLTLTRVYDLTDPLAVAELGIVDTPSCFDERRVARAIAGFLRDVVGVEAILVPRFGIHTPESDRVLVLFLDRLEHPLDAIVQKITPSGSFQID